MFINDLGDHIRICRVFLQIYTVDGVGDVNQLWFFLSIVTCKTMLDIGRMIINLFLMLLRRSRLC
jgi:hypothetical protein